MKKLAIFVEGKTEQIFVQKLLREIAGKFKISIEIQSRQGNNRAKVIMKDAVTSETKFYVLIYNSCNDETVVSDMRELTSVESCNKTLQSLRFTQVKSIVY